MRPLLELLVGFLQQAEAEQRIAHRTRRARHKAAILSRNLAATIRSPGPEFWQREDMLRRARMVLVIFAESSSRESNAYHLYS